MVPHGSQQGCLEEAAQVGLLDHAMVPDWSNESNNSVAALLMPESNDKAPEGAANGSAQPLAQPDTANGPDGGSEAPVADPAQARREAEAAQRLADSKVAMADAAALRSAEHCADMVDRLGLTGVEGNYAGLLSPSRVGKRKRSTRSVSSLPEVAGGRTGGKGLRHFSMKVCEKVESKGRTTYNEVADELVKDFSSPEMTGSPANGPYDEKNIRRRVYDALNVLMAMDIITKVKKEILWCGLPSGGSDSKAEWARQEKARLRSKLESHHGFTQELLIQQRGLRNLILRNRDMPIELMQKAAGDGVGGGNGPTPLQLPFMIIQASSEAKVELQMSEDSTQVQFDFHRTPFKVHGDNDLLKMMSMHSGDWPLPPGIVRPTLPAIPVVRPAGVPGATAAAGSTARPATSSAVPRSGPLHLLRPSPELQAQLDEAVSATSAANRPAVVGSFAFEAAMAARSGPASQPGPARGPVGPQARPQPLPTLQQRMRGGAPLAPALGTLPPFMTQPTPGQHGPGAGYPSSRPAFAGMPPHKQNGLHMPGPPPPVADAAAQAQQMQPPLKRPAVQPAHHEPPNGAPRPTPGASQAAAPRPVGQLHRQPAAAAAGLDDASPPRMIHGLPRNGASPIGALGRPYGGANGAWPGYTAGQSNGVVLGQQRCPQLPSQHTQQQHQQGQLPPSQQPQPPQPSAKPAGH